MRSLYAPVLGFAALTAAVTFGLKVADPAGTQMKTFADAFLETLDAKQRSTAVVPYDSPTRVGWHFIPKNVRKGVALRDMNTAQRTTALRLVRAALSEAGYDKATKIMALEQVLQNLEGEDRTWARDPQKYYVTVFGVPSNEETWGLSFEGHHLSLNFVCSDGKVTDSTPQFLGANPATIKHDAEGMLGKGTRVLRSEEQLAFDLVNSLSGDKADRAVIADEAPAEIRFTGEAQADVGEPEGIAYSDLGGDQKELLRELVMTYVKIVPEPVAERRRKVIEQNGWDNVHFAWAGAKEPGIGHYYRVRGDDFLIEFVNTQPDPLGNPANHIHCVFRDLTGDFGLAAK